MVFIRSSLLAAIRLVSYISNKSKKYDNSSGPKTSPKIPNNGMPIKTPITDIIGWVLARRLLMIIRRMLSMLPMISKPPGARRSAG